MSTRIGDLILSFPEHAYLRVVSLVTVFLPWG